MIDLDKLIIDQHKYIIRCSRCGDCFYSIVEILDIIPVICGKCNIDMPILFDKDN
jgi:Zn finger protein HypA/HybF involved in hydrogenase expression